VLFLAHIGKTKTRVIYYQKYGKDIRGIMETFIAMTPEGLREIRIYHPKKIIYASVPINIYKAT